MDEARIPALDNVRIPADPLLNIRAYNQEMTISQAIRYFERQGVFFTKPVVQGYVRAGILPPLKERRYYTRTHMVLLAVIGNLREGFSPREIKSLFGALEAVRETGSGNSEGMLAAYGAYTALLKEVYAALNSLPEELTASAGDGGPAGFLIPAALMAGSVMLREMAEKLLNGKNAP